MKQLRNISLVAMVLAAMALAGPATASATVLEVGGTIKYQPVAITASLEPESSSLLSLTGGTFANTCTKSTGGGVTTNFTGASIVVPVGSTSFSSCTRPMTFHNRGSLAIEHIAGTTNGTVRSSGTEATVGSPIGTLTCTTPAAGTHIGTLTGKASGQATLDVNAVMNCGFLAPSATWNASYAVTSPGGLGVAEEPPPVPTTLEVGGIPKNEALEITASLESGNSALLSLTGGGFGNTCTSSHATGTTTSPFTGSRVTAPISSLAFSSCTRPVTVHKAGSLYVEHIAGTTNGTVFSEGAEMTVGSPIGTLTCTTAGNDIGTLTGKASGQATLDLNAVINCGFLAPTTVWSASYVVTSPGGLGVTEEPPPVPTTLELGGTPKNEAVEITASLESGTSTILSLTGGGFANTCTSSHAKGTTTSPFTGARVTAPLGSLSFTSCTRPVTVHKAGSLYVEHIAGTTNGTVFSEGAELTVGSPIGTLTCTTPPGGNDLGTLTGKASGQATLDVQAVVNCGFFAPSATWNASYVITSPEGLGVTE